MREYWFDRIPVKYREYALIIFILVLIFSLLQLKATGFCYSKMRYLSEKEIINSYFKLLEENKEDIYNQNDKDNCCNIITFEPFLGSDKYMNAAFGIHYYYVEEYIKNYRDIEGKYYVRYFSLSSCGTKLIRPDFGNGESISEDWYIRFKNNLKIKK